MSVSMGRSRDIDGVWEEGAEEIGFTVKSGVYGCSEEDFGHWWRRVGE